MYKVLKKDGRVEDFDWAKLSLGIINAGASKEDAEEVATEVEEWLNTVADEGTVKSYDLHVKVIQVLKEINPVAGEAFETFRKPDPTKE